MTVKQKNTILSMVYFTLAAFTILFSVLFMVFLATQAGAMYQQIMYYALSVIAIILVVLDIIFTIIRRNKFVIGVLIFILTILTIIMGMVLYVVMNVDGTIAVNNLFGYTGMMALSYMIVVMLIVVYSVGEKLTSNIARVSKRKNSD